MKKAPHIPGLFITTAKFDELAKSRHTRDLCAVALVKEQSGYPVKLQLTVIPGFPFSRK
jgi:hypothetical protein